MNSPHPSGTATPTSPRGSLGRPPLMKRHSSQSSTGRHNVTSPGSAGTEHHPLRHAVGGRQRQTKFAMPRNYSSGRNLAKMGRQGQQTQHAEDGGRRHVRQRSHENDTEIRLPGSLDDRPTIRRNMTAYQLPRNTSHAKLKKNLSHGQLTKLQGSGRSSHNLQGMTSSSQRAPPSPGLKGKSKRPKSAEIVPSEKDLHEQEVELARQQQGRDVQSPKKVGFAVGSSGDTTEGDDETPPMEGAGLQEDEWTDQSASASPYSTRQNTANNSRRTSVVADKLAEQKAAAGETQHMNKIEEAVQAPRTDSESEPEPIPAQAVAMNTKDNADSQSTEIEQEEEATQPLVPAPQVNAPPPNIRSPLHAAKEHPNPTTRRLVSHQLPAPAQLSNVNTLDDGHSNRGSPAPSLHSMQSTIADVSADQDAGELVSRFIPSTSHPSVGSGSNTGAMNTPRHGSFHTPEEDGTLERQARAAPFQVGPTSPGSIISGSSGTTTPALGRSRIELRMMHDKALADREAAAGRKPLVPHHIYDRRNETLKSYLNLVSLGSNGEGGQSGGIPPSAALSLGPEIFQGRFKAINTELKVVQKFRDPISEAVIRLRACKGTKLSQQRSPQKASAHAAALKTSKSAVSLPSRHAKGDSSQLSTSASPPKTTLASNARSALPLKAAGGHSRRGVSFAGPPPKAREVERSHEDEGGADAIAQALWDSVGS